jgi:hypothetical protein
LQDHAKLDSWALCTLDKFTSHSFINGHNLILPSTIHISLNFSWPLHIHNADLCTWVQVCPCVSCYNTMLDSLSGIVRGYGLDGWGSISGRRKRFSKTPQLNLGPTQPATEWIPGLLPLD